MKNTTRKVILFLVILISSIVFTKDNTHIIDLNSLLIDRGIMVASWYGPGFHGKKTASGEVYDQMALTAAHKKYQFGSILKITNPENGKMVIVRINDRGPYIKGRELDLSKGAAIELGMIQKGVTQLQIQEIDLSPEVLMAFIKDKNISEDTSSIE